VEKAKQGGAILARPREYLTRIALPSFGAWLAKLGVTAVFLAGYGIAVTFHTVMSVGVRLDRRPRPGRALLRGRKVKVTEQKPQRAARRRARRRHENGCGQQGRMREGTIAARRAYRDARGVHRVGARFY
jgi:hypothetical protein